MTNEEFVKVMDEHNNALYKYVCYFTKDAEEAERITQQTVEHAYTKRRALAATDDVNVFLRGIAKDIVCKKNRSKFIQPKIFKKTQIEEPIISPFYKEIVMMLANKDAGKELKKAIRKIKHEEMQIIVLHYGYAETFTDIATMLGLQYVAVLDKHQDALKNLRQELENAADNHSIAGE